MTQAFAVPDVATAPAATGQEPGFGGTLRSEWTKMRTLKSTPITLLITAALVIGVSALITWASAGSARHGTRLLDNPIAVVQSGWGLGQLAFEVLGVLVISNEYSSGMIAATLLATPKRLRVFLAKVAVFTGVVFVLSEVMSFADFFAAHAVIAAYPRYANPGLGANDVLRAVVGMGLTATLIGLIGLALAGLLRNTAGAITASVAVLFVLPLLLELLPTSWRNPVEEYWPTQAGAQLESLTRGANALSAWWGTGDLALFVAVLLVASGFVFVRRDA